MRKLIYGILAVVVLLKLAEIFIAQPFLMDEVKGQIRQHEPQVTVKSIETSGADIHIKQLSLKAAPDPLDINGSLTVDLFGKPSVHIDLIPKGSQLWHADRLVGRVTAWIDGISLTDGLITNVYALTAPKLVIPRIEMSAQYSKQSQQTIITIKIPQFGGGVNGARLTLDGQLNHNPELTGNFKVTLTNPAAVIDFLVDTKLIRANQAVAIQGLFGGSKSEITLPLNLKGGALFLGPIRLYPRSSKDDTLARIADSGVTSLFRSFGKVLQ